VQTLFGITGLYNPKAFIAHAALLGQTFVHCRRSSTAASRVTGTETLARLLREAAVEDLRQWTKVVLSHPLDIFALVSHYLTN